MKSSNCSNSCEKKTSIGGQALIEGIMMKGPHRTVISVRRPDGTIETEDLNGSAFKKNKFLRLPIVRGVSGFIESMAVGYKALMLSAERSGMLDDEEAEKEKKAAKKHAAESGKDAGVDESAEVAEAAETANAEVAEAAETASAEVTEAAEAASADGAAATAEAESAAEETAAADSSATDIDEAAAAEADLPDAAELEQVPADGEPLPDEAEMEKEVLTSLEADDSALADSAAKAAEAAESADTDKKAEKGSNSVATAALSVLSAVLGLALALVLFMYLPHAMFTKLNSLSGVNITAYQALFEGVIKIIIFVAYMAAVSCMKDIKRVFMYHGAEHKTIFCYEHGLPLTVENVRKQRRFHPRCGTSFLILMLIVSIIVCQLLLFIPGIKAIATSDMFGFKLLWVFIKLLTIPLICGLGYELIKFCGRRDNLLTKIISAPGVWLQHISTKEPDDSMIEVAIEAMKAVIPENEEDDRW